MQTSSNRKSLNYFFKKFKSTKSNEKHSNLSKFSVILLLKLNKYINVCLLHLFPIVAVTKLPQTWRPKTQNASLKFLKARILKSLSLGQSQSLRAVALPLRQQRRRIHFLDSSCFKRWIPSIHWIMHTPLSLTSH